MKSLFSDAEIRGVGRTSQRARDRMITQLQTLGIADEEVLRVMALMPRHLFVSSAMSHHAYEGKSLPIGFGQTISQPYTVAKMTELLRQHCPAGVVFEIGTGSGYQAAVLGALYKKVYSVERVPELHRTARDLLHHLGYKNIRTQLVQSKQCGWSTYAPFDAMMLTAAPEKLPECLLDQLTDGGVIVYPEGPQDKPQQLKVLLKHGAEDIEIQTVEAAQFVPLK